MGIQNPNSTDYEHPNEPNLLNVHKALDYNDAGEPSLRVKSFIQGDVVIQGDVNVPGTVTIDNQHDNPVHCHVENEAGTSLAINDNGGSITVDGTDWLARDSLRINLG
jgi:riboflavin synthase alpha subunit